MAIHITGLDEADQILTDNPFALLAGMMLDQQYPMEHAFRGPSKVTGRLGGFDPRLIDGQTERLWVESSDGKDLLKRVQALPGFGAQKAKIFVALLAKQLDVRKDGWEALVGDYALDGYRSVADVVDPESLQKVRTFKKEKKAAAKAAPPS
jgi:hypothetical protein